MEERSRPKFQRSESVLISYGNSVKLLSRGLNASLIVGRMNPVFDHDAYSHLPELLTSLWSREEVPLQVEGTWEFYGTSRVPRGAYYPSLLRSWVKQMHPGKCTL